ncbi:hypothetical protein GALL_475260 [mine drainage metagenome]|jgi:hypothetical protein|uniref:Uncharacterized protein n=1 Tax=mine drainage metagenome TaxID=410659 RepID=A0A1J5Q4R9_9ZZZZ
MGQFTGPGIPGYQSTGNSFSGELQNFSNSVSQSPLAHAADGFFTVTAGGACPTWSLTLPIFNQTFVIDEFCQPWALQLYPLIAAAVLVLSGFAAFYIAFL